MAVALRVLMSILASVLVAYVLPTAAAEEPVAINPSGHATAQYVAISGSGNATCGASLSHYEPCLAVSATGNSTGHGFAASATGNATSEGIPVQLCIDGCDFGSGLAASGTGNARCDYIGSLSLCAAISVTGNARCTYWGGEILCTAISVTGHAPGGLSACDAMAAQGRPEACVDPDI